MSHPVLVYFIIILPFMAGAMSVAATGKKRSIRRSFYLCMALIVCGWVLSGMWLLYVVHHTPK
jgi:uncharacterized membrane protein (DUF485 family)